MYRDFAYIYDELMDDVDYKKWFEYIETIIEKKGLEVEDILEMACGTGKLSEYFLREGYKLTCFDLSDDMLSVAENRLRAYSNKELLCYDMVEFKHKNSYDLIMSNCDSLNYIIDKSDLLKTFKNTCDNLRDDGIFIFDINSPYKLRHVLGNNIFIEDREDIFYTWENFLYEDERLVEFFLSFFVREAENSYRRFDEEHIERIYEIDEIISLLEEAGFKNIEYYEAFKFTNPRNNSERISFIAMK